MPHKSLLRFSALVLLLAACDKKEPIPAYVELKPFVVNAEGGAAAHKVTEAWFRINKTVLGEFLGAYTLPSAVPVLSEGETEIVILPGVKENGVAATPGLYPFFVPFTTKLQLKPGEAITVTPVTSYDPNTKFAWSTTKSSFDGSSIPIDDLDGDKNQNYKFSNDGFEGRCVLMEVDTAHIVMEIATDKVILPARADRPTWIELHHRNDIPFLLNLIGYDKNGSEKSIPVFQFNPTKEDGWNKIYLNITDITANEQIYKEGFKVFLRAVLPRDISTGKYTKIKGNVRLDNLRILHF
jgi:hypothetical protein